MSKFFKDHPAFARLQTFIERQVLACRPASIQMAIERTRSEGIHTQSNPDFVQATSDAAASLEARMRKRLRRYYGLNGKYVGH